MDDDAGELVWLDGIRDGWRPCPTCGKTMRVEKKKGIEIDVCPEHGIWLDAGELDAIIKAVRRDADRLRRKQLHRARESAKREGKLQGAFWGFWSLLGD